MALAPEAELIVAQLRAAPPAPVYDVPIADTRVSEVAWALMAAGEPQPVADTSDLVVGDVPVRVYTPSGSPTGVVVYLHGGGFVFGSIETHDPICRRLANAAGAVVVSVGYRLAPEHRFPAALEDAYAVVGWAAERGPVAVAGDSAGGNLAAAVALLSRDRGGPPLDAQVLVYPVIDARCATPSFAVNAEGYLLDAPTMRWFWDCYLGPDGAVDDPLASPCRAADLAGLPPALVVTAEYDPLRDEGEAYAEQLRAAGVPVTRSRYDGMIHGFLGMPAVLPQADRAMTEVATMLRSSFRA